jgi:hypothetical protein
MDVFSTLKNSEDEIFSQMSIIEKEISELKDKQSKLRELAKVLNFDRLKKMKNKEVKK